MVVQSEALLEKRLIEQLVEQGYEKVEVVDDFTLKANLKKQLEKLNKVALKGEELTEEEFSRIMLHLDKGSLYKKSEILRDKYALKRERDNNEVVYLDFLNKEEWCKNIFQVSQQIEKTGKYSNRYDVTILINGLPLVQIELKRRGLNIKEAFNQILRYHKHSYSGLFHYTQLFVISNGVDTKYYSNNSKLNYKFTFYWTDKNNNRISDLTEFAGSFLDRCHLYKMLSKYIVLNNTSESLMVLRPYQFYAVEAILNKALISNDNGYIWHTTGSGKTLTSFKASQLLAQEKNIDKIVFVVDRRDLDYQTTKEFNSFCKGSVDGTDNTASLVSQLTSSNKMVITTIQKLIRAIDNDKYEHKMNLVKNNKIILIFDECHRSQFGDMHKTITDYFTNIHYFGFTGTPIFADNANNNRTTKTLFGECLHKYQIKDAINDGNVLGFAVEYVGRYVNKNSRNQPDINVEDIDTKELMESEKRLEAITEYIINNHGAKTYNKEYTGIFAISSVNVLHKYYELFSRDKSHNLKIATIFSYSANEEGDGGDEHSRDKLERYIIDYNSMFGTNFSTDTFSEYYIDVAKRVKNKEIDILLVVNMFLTGFDSKPLNTLYVDKNLNYHGLIQAFSRTNRVFTEKKKHGNIVCFRNLKKKVDEAITLYSDPDAVDVVLMAPYEDYVMEFNKSIEGLRDITTEVRDIDNLESENEKLEFIKQFRELLRLKTRLQIYTEFDFNDLHIDEQTFADYQSKYLDLYEEFNNPNTKEKVSILEEVDFEIELLKRDDINVNYILNLLKDLDKSSVSYAQDRKAILDIMDKTRELRSKKELIERFIDSNLQNLSEENGFDTEFESFIDREKKAEIEDLIEQENLKKEVVQDILEEYEFSGKLDNSKIKESFIERLGLKNRKVKIDYLINQIQGLVEKFAWS